MQARIPIVAIVGRPNVGKSTFFNRAVGRQQAVVEDIPGVTRDRNYANVERYSIPFYLVDTGGFEAESEDIIQKQISEQVLLAVEEADVIICVFDAHLGTQPGDEEVVKMLRRSDRPVRYLANKCDGVEQSALRADFFSLGIDDIGDCSALHGRGVESFIESVLEQYPGYEALRAFEHERSEVELEAKARGARFRIDLDELEEYAVTPTGDNLQRKVAHPEVFDEAPRVAFAPVFVPGEGHATPEQYVKSNRLLPFPEHVREGEEEDDDLDEDVALGGEEAEEVAIEPLVIENIKVALIGRPNVGKSTLLNTLTGEQRAITSPIAGTTRDSINTELTRDGQKFTLIDTAGLRKKAKVDDKLEHFSVLRSLRAISDCDVAVVVLDATTGPTDQDAKVVGLAHDQGKGIVLAVNKWDLVEKDHRSVKEFEKDIREVFKFSPYASLIFISALSGRRCPRVLESAKAVAYSRAQKVTTYQLNKVLTRAIHKKNPPFVRGRPIKLFFGTQVETSPPRFVLFFNYPESVHFSYLRYLKNCLREAFGFDGTDIKLVCRKR